MKTTRRLSLEHLGVPLNPHLQFKPEQTLGSGWKIQAEINADPLRRLRHNVELFDAMTDVERSSQIPVTPKQRLARVLERNLRPVSALDLEVLLTLDEFIPAALKERSETNRPLSALCLGTVLESPVGAPYVLYLYRWDTRFEKGWRFHYLPFEYQSEYVPLTCLVINEYL